MIVQRFIRRNFYKVVINSKEIFAKSLKIKFDNNQSYELEDTIKEALKDAKYDQDVLIIEEKNKRKAEMNVLQAQIKPHFMYNTLDIIRWMAEEHNEEYIVEIIEAFTSLLRISLSNGKEIINAKDELRYVESYLKIKKIRCEDKLNYKIEFDENILNYKMK